MKMIMISMICVMLTGCAASRDQLYYDATKSVSRDNTVAQTACWNAVAEIAKNSDTTTRALAIAMAERCRNAAVQVNAPQRNILGF